MSEWRERSHFPDFAAALKAIGKISHFNSYHGAGRSATPMCYAAASAVNDDWSAARAFSSPAVVPAIDSPRQCVFP